MRFNFRKVLFIFSALLMFAISGELAAQDLLTLVPQTASISVEGDTTEVLTAVLQDAGVPVPGETIYFEVLNDLGEVSPTSGTTNSYGQISTTYYAYKTAGTDTVVAYWYEVASRQDLADTVIITINPGLIAGFNVGLEGGVTFIWPWDDTVNIEVTAVDTFGNTTDVGLPLNVRLSANRTEVDFLGGTTCLMQTAVELYPMVATAFMSGLIITVEDVLNPSINGSSYPINVGTGVEERPIVSDISAAFGTGDISYAVAEDGEVAIKVYNKVGMEVGSLVEGVVKRGYYQASLEGMNLSSDVYFVVMQGPGVNKKIKATLIK